MNVISHGKTIGRLLSQAQTNTWMEKNEGSHQVELPSSAEAVKGGDSKRALSSLGHGEVATVLGFLSRDLCCRWTSCSSVAREKSPFFLPGALAVFSDSGVSAGESRWDNSGRPTVEGVPTTKCFPLLCTVALWENKSCSGCSTHGGLIQQALCRRSLTSNWQRGWSMSRSWGKPSASSQAPLIPSQGSTGQSCRSVDWDTILPGVEGACSKHSSPVAAVPPGMVLEFITWPAGGLKSLSAMSKNHPR